MASTMFFGLMGVASAVSLARGFVIASLLDLAAFGTYAVLVAVGAFLSILLSAGSVEQTQKTYPRLWTAHRRVELVAAADVTAKILAFRAAALMLALLLLALLFGASDRVPWIAAAAFIAMSGACSSLYASAHRASQHLSSMGAVTLQRALLAITLGGLGAWWASWPGAIAGEVFSGIVGACLSRARARSLSRATVTAPGTQSSTEALPGSGSGWFFGSAIAAAIPAYLDRLFVANQWGAEAVGRYGFLFLFVTSANVVAGIVAQKIGPQLVQMAHSKASLGQQVRLAGRWVGGCSLAFLVGMAVAGYILLGSAISPLATKLQIDIQLLGLATMLCVLQVGIIVEWLLISRDRERDVYVASTIYLLAALILCAAASLWHTTLAQFVAGLVVIKAVHLTLLLAYTGQMRLAGSRAAR